MLSWIRQMLPEKGMVTAVPAHYIDQAHLMKTESYPQSAWKFVKLRLWYTAFFIASAVDVVSSFAMTARHAFGASTSTLDASREWHLQKFGHYVTLLSKNLLVFITMPIVAPTVYFGLVGPGTVTARFLAETPQKGAHAGGNLYHSHENVVEKPEDIEELQAIIQRAIQEKRKIMPVGAGRSQGKQFLPETENGIVVDLANFNTIEIHSDKKIAIVGAGVRWSDLQIQANQHKLAIQVMQASNVFSVGGSIGTNIHGWKHTMGTLSNTILAITIINAKGELQELTPNDDLFHAITGGLGLLGIVVKATLQLTDNELLNERAKEVAISHYTDYFYQHVLPDSDVRMHLFRLSLDPKHLLEKGIAVNYELVPGSKPRKTPNLSAERHHGTREERILLDAARELGEMRKVWWNGEVKRLLANNSAAQTTNAIMQPPINAMFTHGEHMGEWLQEYFLPADNLAVYVDFLGKLLVQNKVALFNASVRFVKANVHSEQTKKSPISYVQQEDKFAVVLCWHQSLEEKDVRQAAKWIRAAQHKAVEMGGTYYLPYQHVSAPDDFDQAYPRVTEFLKIKQTVDPDNLFASGLYQKYMTPRAPELSHIRAVMKTKETQKEFSGFLENVLQRVDSEKLYSLLNDILAYKDTDAEVYEELCKRLPEIMPGTVNSLRRILNSLSTIKFDLGNQAKDLLSGRKEINGLVEIGYPGRFVAGFKEHFKVTGKIIVVLDQLSMTDYIQTGFPAPYDEFKKLDYSKPSLIGLETDSADVITCYVGLHHFPVDELEGFLEDVRRVLRPNGHFLLVDHDVVDEQSMHYAHAAHTIFNAVNGVSLQDELNETRNFHPMSYWQSLLEKHGLDYATVNLNLSRELIRDEDASRNRMVDFKKPIIAEQPTLQGSAPLFNQQGRADDQSIVRKRAGLGNSN